jgi:hypothetical protein
VVGILLVPLTQLEHRELCRNQPDAVFGHAGN